MAKKPNKRPKLPARDEFYSYGLNFDDVMRGLLAVKKKPAIKKEKRRKKK